jgi:hypothetical protein
MMRDTFLLQIGSSGRVLARGVNVELAEQPFR